VRAMPKSHAFSGETGAQTRTASLSIQVDQVSALTGGGLELVRFLLVS
jgi:hypothetical protein